MTEIKVFTKWCAGRLKQRNIPFESLSEFQDGSKLIILLEIIFNTKISAKWHSNPKNRFQKIENCNVALNFIQCIKKIKLIGIHAEDIVDGYEKLICGLVSTCSIRYLSDSISYKNSTGYDALLSWCKDNTHGYADVNIINFTSSWSSGLGFCALINHFRPDELDYNTINRKDIKNTISTAFDTCKKLGIPVYFDTTDFLGAYTIDNTLICLQLSEFYYYFTSQSNQSHSPNSSNQKSNIIVPYTSQPKNSNIIIPDQNQSQNSKAHFQKSDDMPQNESNLEIEKMKKIIDSKDAEILLLKKKIETLEKNKNEQINKINDLYSQIQETQRKLDKQSQINKDLERQLKESNKTESKQEISNSFIKPREFQILEVSDLDQLRKIKKLGHGATSEVFKVARDQHFALKVFDAEICKKEHDDNEEENDNDDLNIDYNRMRNFMKEYETLNQLDHPNIIKTYGFCFGDSKHEPAILLDYCPYSLKSTIKKLNDDERITIIIEIVEAMKHVHSIGIIHRDLKPENILLDSEKHVKISDFGLCTLIKPDSPTMSRTQMSGTLNFMAPEILQGRTDYNEKVDVYAFGVVLYMILNRGEYPNISFADASAGKKAKIPSNVTDFSRKLIDRCWSSDPDDRPSFDEIFESLRDNKNDII